MFTPFLLDELKQTLIKSNPGLTRSQVRIKVRLPALDLHRKIRLLIVL